MTAPLCWRCSISCCIGCGVWSAIFFASWSRISRSSGVMLPMNMTRIQVVMSSQPSMIWALWSMLQVYLQCTRRPSKPATKMGAVSLSFSRIRCRYLPSSCKGLSFRANSCRWSMVGLLVDGFRAHEKTLHVALEVVRAGVFVDDVAIELAGDALVGAFDIE